MHAVCDASAICHRSIIRCCDAPPEARMTLDLRRRGSIGLGHVAVIVHRGHCVFFSYNIDEANCLGSTGDLFATGQDRSGRFICDLTGYVDRWRGKSSHNLTKLGATGQSCLSIYSCFIGKRTIHDFCHPGSDILHSAVLNDTTSSIPVLLQPRIRV